MADRRVALLRGINVGKAKRVAMADLRALVEELGYTDVKTLLNSGNLVFTVPAASRKAKAPVDAGTRIEEAMSARLGVSARVIVLTAAELATIVAENPLGAIATNPSRHLVTILARPADRSRLLPLTREDWSPEALALGARAAYVWCPEGVLASRLGEAVARALGDAGTARNWATLSKLDVLARAGG